MTMRAQTGGIPRILDLSRTVARGVGRVPTGIDRIEIAYLGWVLGQPGDAFGLVRTRIGYLLLDRKGLTGVSDVVGGRSESAKADLLSQIAYRRDPARARLETLARKLAVGRSSRRGLGAMLRRLLPDRTEYLNVGHSNLTERVFRALSQVPNASSTIVLSDLLPLTHPKFTGAAATRKAERLARVVSAQAGRVVHISASGRATSDELLGSLGRCPPGLVAPLGLRKPQASGRAGTPVPGPYFLAVGTLEPRKNLGFLIDLWEALDRDPDVDLPTLVLAGGRGWESDAFFDRLTGHPLFGTRIRWIESPPDDAVDTLLLGSHGLLFPSHAEGQGLPPLEAACVGVPVLCQQLPPIKELLGGYPGYVSCDDLAGWIEKIKGLLAGQAPQRLTVPDTLPTWEDHFSLVFGDDISRRAGDQADKGSALCV